MKLNFSLLLFFVVFILNAQTRDVLYLKNGSVIKGSITEMNPSSGIKIKTSDGSIFVYKMQEVLKTEKEEFNKRSGVSNSSPSIPLKSLSDFFSNFFINKKLNALKYVGVSKVNGVRREIYGQKIYDVEYELLIQANQDIFISDRMNINTDGFIKDFKYLTKQPSGWGAYMNTGSKKVTKGQRILVNGSMTYEQTDNGWRAKNYRNKNYKIVAPNYVSPTMAKQIAEERANLEAKLKKQLDWRVKDIDPVDFKPEYFSLKDIPFFSYGNSLYSIKPSSSYIGRNDLTSRIQKSFFQSISSTNRSIKTDVQEYNSSDNKGRYRFQIMSVNFNFINQGYQCSISVRGSAKGEYKSPKKYPFGYALRLSGKSSRFKRGMSKSEAFNSALSDFKNSVRHMILKHEPIQLDFIKIKTNKRGKVREVVFKKPTNFINVKKMKFILLRPSDITLENNNFKILNKIGDCIFKGEIINDEIICEVKGRKNKKAFEKYMETSERLIGLSTF